MSTLEITPEELIQVTPPSRIAAGTSQPNRRPATNPGVTFRPASTIPGTSPVRRPAFSSSDVYSNPSISNRSSTPISAANEMTSSGSSNDSGLPSPSARPASR